MARLRGEAGDVDARVRALVGLLRAREEEVVEVRAAEARGVAAALRGVRLQYEGLAEECEGLRRSHSRSLPLCLSFSLVCVCACLSMRACTRACVRA